MTVVTTGSLADKALADRERARVPARMEGACFT
jgi:hypothetical protein